MPVTILQESFQKGLSPDKRIMSNSQFLSRAYGPKVSEFGCVALENVKPASPNNAAPWNGASWPFPQIFRLERDTIVLGESGLYKWENGAVTQIPVWNRTSNGVELLSESDFSTVNNWVLTNCFHVPAEQCVKKTSSLEASIRQDNVVEANKLYSVKVKITDVEAEGEIYVTLGGVQSSRITAEVGTFNFVVKVGATPIDAYLFVNLSAPVKLTINSVSMKEIEPFTFSLSPASRPFHAASFKEVFILTNGSITFFHSSSNGPDPESSLAFRTVAWNAEEAVKIGCVESLNNRLYMSGFNPEDAHYDSEKWDKIWDLWVQFHTLEATYEGLGINRGTVFFSRAGAGDYYWPFSVEMAMFGIPDNDAYEEAMPFILDSIKKRDIGFFHPTYGGETLRILKLGQNLVLYGTNGVSVAQPLESEDGIAHSVVKLSDVGLLDKNAVSPIEGGHLFLDTAGRAWVITSDLQIQSMGGKSYSETFEGEGGFVTNVATKPIMMHFDTGHKDLYISNGAKSYVRSTTGLSEIKKAYSGMMTTQGDLYGYWHLLDIDTRVYIRTESIDFQERMLKNIHDVEIGRYDVTNLYARVWYRTSGSSGWRMSDWILCVEGGFAVPLIEGHDIQLEFRYEPGPDARFEYVKINWQRRDLRNFRSHQSRVF